MAIAALVAARPAIAGARGARQPVAAGSEPRISDLAAGASRLFVLRANDVVWFDADGREVGRCPRFESTPPERPRPSSAGAIDAGEALRAVGLPDDDLDSSEAEDVLDAEDLEPKRRRRSSTPEADGAVVARALAASPASDDVWIATSAGVYRGRGHGCGRVALAGRDVVAVAAGDGAVAVATPDLLWRSDGGGAFRVAAGLVARPRALAAADVEHTLVATDDAVVEIGPFGVTRPVLDHGADALAVCDGLALALAGDGVWAWSGDAPPQRVGDRPPARTVTCGDTAGARFVAAGGGLYTSADGAAWRAPVVLPGPAVGHAAALAGRLWVALDDQLVAIGGALPPRPRPGGIAAPPSPLPPPATRRLLQPVLPWPQLTLVLAGVRTPLRASWSLVVLVAFRFGRTGAAGADRRLLAAELVRRDAALAAEEQELSVSTDDDPSRTARLRAARQEREALR
ncbi:MAG TPA: hypothetical protein VIF57_13845 [Polyangia bacterium]